MLQRITSLAMKSLACSSKAKKLAESDKLAIKPVKYMTGVTYMSSKTESMTRLSVQMWQVLKAVNCSLSST